MRLFDRGGIPSRGLSGQIARVWQDPVFHRQHPFLAALLERLFPDLCPCTKVIPGYGTPLLFAPPPGTRAGWPEPPAGASAAASTVASAAAGGAFPSPAGTPAGSPGVFPWPTGTSAWPGAAPQWPGGPQGSGR